MKDIKFVVARYEKDGYSDFLGKSNIEKYNPEFVWNEEANGLYSKYNVGIDRLISKGLDDDDIVAFCHADVKITDKQFEQKLKYVFDKVPLLGVAGVIGATILQDNCGWWLSDTKYHKGAVTQWMDNGTNYEMIRQKGNFIDLMVVDGLFIAVRGSLVKKQKFDSATFPDSYNFYDYDYCITARKINGMLVGAFDITMEHKSMGSGIYQDDWKNNRVTFVDKWIKLGYKFPIR